MNLRLSQICSVLLVVMVVLPCTAPFPTCGAADWLGGSSHQDRPLTPGSSSTPADGEFSYAPPLATSPGRLRILLLAEPSVHVIFLADPAAALPPALHIPSTAPPFPERQAVLRR
jgi:hypothetical protein